MYDIENMVKDPEFLALSEDEQVQLLETALAGKPQELQTMPSHQPVQYGQMAVSHAPQERPGFIDRVEEDLSQRGETIQDIFSRRPLAGLPGSIALTAGQVAGGVGDVIGETVSSAVSNTFPETTEDVKRKLHEFTQTPIGKMAVNALQQGTEAFAEFEKQNPDAAQSLTGMLNLATLGVGKKGIDIARKEVADISTDVGVLSARKFPKNVDKQLSSKVQIGINKAIRPSVTSQRSATQAQRYMAKAEDAVKTIVENKNNLNLTDEFGDIVQTLPTNLRQFSEAIDNTKKQLFAEFDSLAQQAGKTGVRVDFKDIIKELDSVAANKGLPVDVKEYALKVQQELADLQNFTPLEAQTRIQALNRKLNSVSDFNSAAPAYVDALVVNNLRKSLDRAVVGATGKEFQILKNKYGSLSTIERDVARRAVVDARRNNKGLLDFTDIFTASQVVRGVATGGATGAADVAGGIIGRFIKERFKRLNDPNTIVSDMFADTEKLLNKAESASGLFIPKSFTVDTLSTQRGM